MIIKTVLLNLINKYYNLVGLSSASLSFVIDFFSSGNFGSIVGVLISAGIGLFAVLKARHGYLAYKEKMDIELEVLEAKKEAELKQIKQAEEAQALQHRLKMEDLNARLGSPA